MKKLIIFLFILTAVPAFAQVGYGVKSEFKSAGKYFKTSGDSVTITQVSTTRGVWLTIENYVTNSDTLSVGCTTASGTVDTSSTVAKILPGHTFNYQTTWRCFWIKTSNTSTTTPYQYTIKGVESR